MCSPLLVVDATLDKSKFKPSHYFRSHRKQKLTIRLRVYTAVRQEQTNGLDYVKFHRLPW